MKHLFWTQPRQLSSDLQLEDPLAFNALETQIAKRLWPGFTRHTTAPAYYVMVCYGLLIAEQAARQLGLTPTDDTVRELFQRWERMWAMAVCVANDGDLLRESGMRGRTGVLEMYKLLRGNVSLDYQFIGRRGELGALGAYLPSLRDHGLVRAQRLRLTPLGWDLAQWLGDVAHETVIDALGRGTIGKNHLAALGKQAALSAINARVGLKPLLWERLFGHLQPLPEMARAVIEASHRGVMDARQIIEGLAKSPMTSAPLRDSATLALVFGDVSLTLRGIFDRIYQTVLADGYASDWAGCVRAAIPQGVANVLNLHISNWRHFPNAEPLMATMAFGPKFNQVMRRMNSQNAYHVFESVLYLHQQMQRMRGKSSWIDRKAEVVYLRHAGYDVRALKGEEWAPGYRMPMQRQLIADLGQL